MLCFPRMFTVREVACDLVIGERLAEPRGAPEQEWHQDEQECENEDARQQGTGKSRPGSALFARRGRWRIALFCKVHPMRGEERARSEEHTSELQSRPHLVCRLLL